MNAVAKFDCPHCGKNNDIDTKNITSLHQVVWCQHCEEMVVIITEVTCTVKARRVEA